MFVRRRVPETSSGPRRGGSGTFVATVSPMEKDTTFETDTQADSAEVVEELLVEEISIDGMCGVY